MSHADALIALLDGARSLYGGEAVTQLDHALQGAWLASQETGREALVAATLLHDLGHVLMPASEDATRQGRDLRHEEVGARYLARCGFPPAVTEPVRLHVAAKRCKARDPAFVASLSEESRRSLALQGGPMTEDQARAFLAEPFAADALLLRDFDDRAKVEGLAVPALSTWRDLLCRQLGG